MNWMTGSKDGTHILVIPYQAPGHMLPLLDLTHQLAKRGLTITVLVTPKILPQLQPLLSVHPSIQTLVIPFPPHPTIPDGVEDMKELPVFMVPELLTAMSEFYNPVLRWFQANPSPPVAILTDFFHSTWSQSLASHLGIRRIGFAPINSGGLIETWCNLGRVTEEYLPESMAHSIVANVRSWGFILSSFTELESENLEQLRKMMGHDRVWAVGPLLPIEHSKVGLNERGGSSSVPANEVLAWLDSCRAEKSVVFVGFGSQISLTKPQMEALATALEESSVRFIWSVKSPMQGLKETNGDGEVPEGFEDRVGGRGLVIRGWAPQVAILKHRAVGIYLTHCGWNSALEGLLNEVFLLVWPMQADHFVNAKLLVDQLGAAIRVCDGMSSVPDSVKLAHALAESVTGNASEKAEALKLRERALNATKEGGSSALALDDLVKELSTLTLHCTK
ncbi:hypothetical protein RJ640_013846 [Escallonia rubra]|uniref:Uncharacterized protein n=1 Tax=Escallonia rubra TaxID=112253 RepID=A0AA88QLZ6_9ASTE|nr:hypothetical protein RJ640_013846 [Escallonia rubra]